ncbi:MAG: MBOAT family protein [Lachnospiraceae bacterium]|nr:MBOAT family protein [Lachnospiraceae bacterium]
MQFTSFYFILVFLPVTLLLYHGIGSRNRSAARLLLLAASFLFCGLSDLWSLFILLAQILVGVFFSVHILRAGSRSARARHLLILAVTLQIAALAYFKYMGFLVGSIGILLNRDMVWQNLILPIGISYTTFTQIAFLADCYRGTIREAVSPVTYALYLAFFPRLVQGPITAGTDLLTELSGDSGGRVTAEGLADGLVLFVLGLSKKIFLADLFGRPVDFAFHSIPFLSTLDILIVILSYSFQIYFDFSGYSDMAIGIARMFGYTLPVNFNSPYRADSITDFWRRWHMSLTGFLREYIYFPLGGSRKGPARTCLNILIVYLLSGLWHGANWTFLLWGLLHGLLQVTERICGGILPRIPRVIRQITTFLWASILWLLFRSPSIGDFRMMLDQLLVDGNWTIRPEFGEMIRVPGVRTILSVLGIDHVDALSSLLSIGLYLAAALLLCLQPRNNESAPYRKTGRLLLAVTALAVLCFLNTNEVSAFLYTSF